MMSGNTEELVRAAGAALGIDVERVERIMESIADPASCTPAAFFAGGETSAWKRVWKLDRGVYQEPYPDSIRQSIQATARENHHILTVSKPQKRQNAVILASVIHNPAISAAQIQTFVRQAREILAHAHQLRQVGVTVRDSAVDPKFWVQGKIYRIAAERQQLTIQAPGSGRYFAGSKGIWSP